MGWKIEYRPLALKALKKLDRQVQLDIYNFLDTRIATSQNPHELGKSLVGPLRGLWRYRVRDYRIICKIEQQKLVVLVVAVGHRSTVYE